LEAFAGFAAGGSPTGAASSASAPNENSPTHAATIHRFMVNLPFRAKQTQRMPLSHSQAPALSMLGQQRRCPSMQPHAL
jgi:hypothetical protein